MNNLSVSMGAAGGVFVKAPPRANPGAALVWG